MAGNRAANRYAKALLEQASDNNRLKEIDEDMRLVNNTINDSKDLRILLKSPIIQNAKKQSCLKAIFKDVHQDILNLFVVLLDNKRISFLSQVINSFLAQVDELNHVTTATVTTAVSLTKEIETKVLKKIKELTNNEATLIKKIDEDLIGGFLLRVGDLQYDTSISGRLKRLKYKFKREAQV